MSQKTNEITKAWSILQGKRVEIEYGSVKYRGKAESWSGLYLTLSDTYVSDTPGHWERSRFDRFTAGNIKSIKQA